MTNLIIVDCKSKLLCYQESIPIRPPPLIHQLPIHLIRCHPFRPRGQMQVQRSQVPPCEADNLLYQHPIDSLSPESGTLDDIFHAGFPTRRGIVNAEERTADDVAVMHDLIGYQPLIISSAVAGRVEKSILLHCRKQPRPPPPVQASPRHSNHRI